MRAVATGSLVIAALLLFATPSFSQPAIAGVVRDTSGAILPGVSVEAVVQHLSDAPRSLPVAGYAGIERAGDVGIEVFVLHELRQRVAVFSHVWHSIV